MSETVNIQLDSNCKGITDEQSRVYRADSHGNVTVPSHIAAQFKETGVVKAARKQFGGFTLPKREN